MVVPPARAHTSSRKVMHIHWQYGVTLAYHRGAAKQRGEYGQKRGNMGDVSSVFTAREIRYFYPARGMGKMECGLPHTEMESARKKSLFDRNILKCMICVGGARYARESVCGFWGRGRGPVVRS